jgi:hypothetical protein
MAYLGQVLPYFLVLLYVFYLLLPLLIYWRCGRILRRLELLERMLLERED